MALTEEEANLLDKSDTVRQKTELGTEVKAQQDFDAYSYIAVRTAIVADATSGATITIPYNMIITDIVVECTTANVAGTITVKSGVNDISDAIICAVDKVIVRAGTLDDTYTTITTASTITAVANGAADRGIVTLLGFRS